MTTRDELRRHAARRLLGSGASQRGQRPNYSRNRRSYRLAIQYGYGEIWHRPGLDQRQRALCAVAAFTALRLDGQALKFGQSALDAGLSRTEIIEGVIQTGPYSGVAPALDALAALSDVLGAGALGAGVPGSGVRGE